MTYENFVSSLNGNEIPNQFSLALQVLWYQKKGRWDRSHEIAQDMNTPEGAWLHAFLHRDEGDNWNAGYWYRQAGKPVPAVSIETEWEDLVRYFLEKDRE
ncbi:MAG: hypothetical protein H6562_19765 [Lewinellaceae bacterium]|nr:hypothetical protein [Lewinellaceae bacterium]